MNIRIKKILTGLVTLLIVASSSTAFALGYKDITSATKARGTSIAPQESPATGDLSNAVTMTAVAAPGQPATQLRPEQLRASKPKQSPKPPHASEPAPSDPAAILPPAAPQICFDAPTEGIYVPLGANTGTIKLTAEQPAYWQTLSPSIANNDDGAGVHDSFPAYIVLESDYNPEVPTTSITFHLRARANAPLGEYCPSSDLGQIGLAAYTKQNDVLTKIFDVPMNIHIVDRLR